MFGEDTGGISGAPGGNLGRIWGESGWFRGDTDICGVYVMCMWCVCAAYKGCTWYACGVDVLCMWFFRPVTSLAGASPLAVPASYLCHAVTAPSSPSSPVSVPGLLGPFPVKLQDGVRI